MTLQDPELELGSDWLKAHARGEVDEEVGQLLVDLATAVQMTGKKGTVTLKITASSAGRTVLFEADADAKLPKHDAEASPWFVGRNGGLTRSDPAQMTLADAERDLPEEVEAPRAQADPETGEIRDI